MRAFMHCLRGWVNATVALCYPELCQLCRQARATPAESFVCADCRAEVKFIHPPFCERCGLPYQGAITSRFECANCRKSDLQFRSARSAVIAGKQVLEIIHRYKYNRAFWFEPLLAQWLSSQAAPELGQEQWDFIVPVPLHPAKQREREFNQAERLGRRLSAATHIPLHARLVQRVQATKTQTLLSRPERIANVRNAFAPRRGARLNGERLVLVDDVMTTGATTSDCARALRQAGAGEVMVWTVARGV
jgi:competence protein ComFC